MSDAWRNKLSRGFRGLDGDVRNVVIALTNHEDWAGKIAYDEFKDTITLRGALPWSEDEAPAETRGGALTPSDVTRIVMWFERAMVIRTDEKTVRQALHVVAEKRPYHPVREYLLGLKWDGEKRLDHVLHTHFGAQDTLYTQTIGPKFLISAVARVMRPGCQVDTVLILESPKQGWKKSSTLRALVPVASWYCESMLPLGRKDAYDNLRGVWIYHLDELESMTRADQSQLKSFITNTHDRYRKAYEVDAQDHPRNNVFVGSTNEKYYLNDSTGGRRFWGCELERIIDVEKVVRDRDQIWAEARVRWERGEKWHIEDSALIELCETEQASRMEENPFLGPIDRRGKVRNRSSEVRSK